MPSPLPGRNDQDCSLVPSRRRRPSRYAEGSASALIFSRPAQRSLTLRPVRSPSRLNDPLHRRLRRLRCLRRRFDCYRVERTSSRAGLYPAVDQRLSRRTAWAIFPPDGAGRDREQRKRSLPVGSSVRMSRGRLFLSGLVSTRARLRFTGCDQYAASKGDAVGSRIASRCLTSRALALSRTNSL